MAGALDGVRILDLSRILAGPWATQLLADMGAEVIKIERPDGGDDTRGWGPPYIESRDGGAREAAYFHAANRGKRSVSVDLASAEGQKIVRELALKSDVLVENFKVGALARYGLDAETLLKHNPRLVYCSITGFGQTGPYATRPGYDLLIQGMGGLMSITGQPDGAPGAGPMKVGVALVDVITGLYAANAITAALRHRDRTGQGQHIDLALLDCLTAALANQSLNYLVTGQSPVRMGNAHPSIVPYDVFPVADGHIILAVGNDAQFRRLCTAGGMDDLAVDPRFALNADRVRHRAELTALLSDHLRRRPSREWLALCEEAGVPAGPVNTIADVFADPQVVHRGLQLELAHEALGTVPGVACPIRFSETPAVSGRAAPVLGEGSREVLENLLGYDDATLAALAGKGVIG